jgi:hypothetical protein
MVTCAVQSPDNTEGNKYFLLLVDDLSWYMWVAAIQSKNRAVAAITKIQAQAEGESNMMLRALYTNRGDEFTAREFTKYYATLGVYH